MFLVTTLHTMSNYLAKYGQAMFCLKICESKIWTLSTFCIRMCCTMYKRENLLIILLFPTLATPRTSDHCILCTFLFICFLKFKILSQTSVNRQSPTAAHDEALDPTEKMQCWFPWSAS